MMSFNLPKVVKIISFARKPDSERQNTPDLRQRQWDRETEPPEPVLKLMNVAEPEEEPEFEPELDLTLEPEFGPEQGSISESDSEPESEPELEIKEEFEKEQEPNLDPEPILKSTQDFECESATEPGSDRESGLEPEQEPESNLEPENAPSMETDSDLDPESDSEQEYVPDHEPESDSDMKPESDMESESDLEPESESDLEPQQPKATRLLSRSKTRSQICSSVAPLNTKKIVSKVIKLNKGVNGCEAKEKTGNKILGDKKGSQNQKQSKEQACIKDPGDKNWVGKQKQAKEKAGTKVHGDKKEEQIQKQKISSGVNVLKLYSLSLVALHNKVGCLSLARFGSCLLAIGSTFVTTL